MNPSVLRHSSRRLLSITSRRCASSSSSAAAFDWQDPLNAASLYTPEELAIQDTARQYCQEKLLPRVLGEYYIHTVLYSRLFLGRERERFG